MMSYWEEERGEDKGGPQSGGYAVEHRRISVVTKYFRGTGVDGVLLQEGAALTSVSCGEARADLGVVRCLEVAWFRW